MKQSEDYESLRRRVGKYLITTRMQRERMPGWYVVFAALILLLVLISSRV